MVSSSDSGLCEICSQEIEDVPHIILPRCSHLKDNAASLLRFSDQALEECAQARNIFQKIISCEDDDKKVQMLLDPAAIPEIIRANQADHNILPLILRVTTTWCYSMNKARNRLLGN